MSRYREENTESKVYVGDLPRDADEKDLERVFGHYGPLKSVWVARNPPGFAFLEFEDARDAEDAVRGLDGTNICGARARVEHATGKVRPKPWQRDGGGGGDRGGSSRYGGGGGGAPPARRGGNFDPSDRCFGCGERGHYSYDCPKNARGGGGGSRRKRTPSRSRSRSREPARRRSYSRSPSRNRDRSRDRSPKRSVSRD